MTDETQVIIKADAQAPQGGDSNFAGVSVRAWIAILLVGTACTKSLLGQEVGEPVYTLVLVAAGFYFGQKRT